MTDHRVFVGDGDEVLEMHYLAVLAEAGVLEPTLQDGQLYAADSPRAWVEAWRTDCCGWNGVLLDESLVGRLVRGVEA